MKHILAPLFFFVLTSSFILAEDDSNDNGPKPPTPFPAAYKDYRILDAGLSPDKQFAIIFPKHSVFDDPKNWGAGLYLVKFKPFKILYEIPIENNIVKAEGDYSLNWASNSSAVVFVDDSKWGPVKVFLITIQYEKAGKITELTKPIRKIVQADYKKSKAERYNDYYDYIFDRDIADYWKINDKQQVVIECGCTTDPNISTPNPWSITFNGIWDISKGEFIKKGFTHNKRINDNQ